MAGKKSHVKGAAFLAAYAKTGNISIAANIAGCSRRDHYRWIKDPAYARTFDDATKEAIDRLEAEARRRATQGVEEPVFGKLPGKDTGTGQVGVIRKYSDTLLIFLLKGANPEKYRERYEHSGPSGAPLTFTLKLDRADSDA
ncbi:MAG: hypothetical protein NUW22_12690 [Acidobacteria bacterium]|nr:hypothetical protein [Acidobacteriota bacterium]